MISTYVFRVWDDRLFTTTTNKLPFYGWTLFLIWALALGIPLPFSILSAISPIQFATLNKASSLTGIPFPNQALSYSFRNALTWWSFIFSLGLFYVVIRDLCADRRTLRLIVWVMLIIGIIESVYGLFQALIPSMGVLWVDYIHAYMGTARGTFINRNNFAGFIEMIWPLAIGLTLSFTGQVQSIKMMFHSDRLNRQALMVLSIIILLLTLILTHSRAGIVSGVLGFFVFFGIGRQGLLKRSRQFLIILCCIFCLLTVYTMSIGIGPVIERFFAIESDGESRMRFWIDSLRIIKDYPLGIGLRNYENVMSIYNYSVSSDKILVYAHNDYLQLLVETGWVGFTTLTSTILIFLVNCLNHLRKLDFRKDPLRFYLAVGAFSGIVSIGVHSFFDFNLQIPANCVYLVVLMAILSACTQHNHSQQTLAFPGTE